MSARRIRTPPELYAHAIAIEREAAERYSEFATRMADLGNEATAEAFNSLAGFEAEHLAALLARTRGIALPDIPDHQYGWLDAAAPETPAREFVFRLLTPRQALTIALRAEMRAQAFFEEVLIRSDDPALRALAREMAADEVEHARILERMLERTPEPARDWLLT